MNQHEWVKLIEKYLAGTATDAEREALLAWYRRQNEEEVIWEPDHEGEEAELKERMFRQIQYKAMPRRHFPWRNGLRIAAVFLLGVAIVGTFSWFWMSKSRSEASLIATAPAKQAENRFILLPDSSRVLLRPGSTLEYRSDFQGKTREVALIGEGYFDIAHREHQPFIIHTGKVRTVVLGTAFTIRSNGSEEVSVTVQRGKVRVEDDRHVLAELEANQQIVYDAVEAAAERLEVKSEETPEWAGEDMRFDALPFSELTASLARRYGVTIRFANKGLEACPVSGGFSGTETLEEVLDFLCATRNASYVKTNDDQILIDGQGCQLK